MTTSRHPNRAEIERAQLVRLRTMLAEMRGNPFYAAKWRGAGFVPEPATLDEFYAGAPFTTKEELVQDQQAHPPYGTNLSYPLERYNRFCQTSGTTGTPLRWLDTPESWSWMVDNWVRVLQVSGVTRADHIFFAFSFGPFLGFWTAFEAGARLGAMCLPGGGMSSAARLRVMLDNRATALCCTPTYAIRLAEVAAEEGIDLRVSTVRTLLVAGEPGAGIPTTRARIERLWPGGRVRDHHGMTEVGPVSYECPEQTGVLHVMEDGFIPEVIDPMTGRPSGPGEKGELVLTNLGRAGSPLVRYRTGDLVQPAPQTPCACGSRELAVEGGILGRVDDMTVIRGVNVYPSAVEETVRAFPAVAEYRVEVHGVHSMPELRVQIEPLPAQADTGQLCRQVAEALRTALNLRVPVSAVPPGTLPRFELKARRWVRVENGNGAPGD